MSGIQPAADICLALLVGLPGSGKTCLANFLKQYFSTDREASEESLSLNVIHICYDSLITADLAHRCSTDPDCGNWRDARQEVFTMVEKMTKMLKEIHTDQETHKIILKCGVENKYIKKDYEWEIVIKKRTVIVIDDNMYYSSMRYSYFQLARRHNVGFCQLYLECTVPSALTYNNKRSSGERVPDDVVRKMADRMEPPENKPWEQYSVSIAAHEPYSTDETVKKIGRIVSKALLDPVQPVEDWSELGEVSRQACMASVLHQCDLGLRHLINERMKLLQKTTDPDDLRAQFKILNTSRLELLEAMKTREILVPEELCAGVQLCHPLAGARLRSYLSTLLPQ
ncbi:hypothetical protein ONE63_007860 [Megalurothrips usitatus]|uniref:L-seryl-tRNA(Sec) kinase n=1 Tax=Megalurothrips usitatus TaxID=439358 RepID=A0AAV7XTX0_9NEOP|nr:hypothetical protein ONE63_007860 [Megalurothrips usitatus]